MRKKGRIPKIGFIFAILVLALAGISASYAGLFDTITIFGSVSTADDFVTMGGSSESAWTRMYDDPEDFTYEFPGANWATYVICSPTEDIQTFYLYAGQHIRVGKLDIWNNSNYLFVKFDLDEDFTMEENHLHVATTLQGIPQTPSDPKPGPIPGLFTYKTNYDPYEQQDTYEIDWNSSWDDVPLYIAAHGVIWGYY